jgi:hypothetical protein
MFEDQSIAATASRAGANKTACIEFKTGQNGAHAAPSPRIERFSTFESTARRATLPFWRPLVGTAAANSSRLNRQIGFS